MEIFIWKAIINRNVMIHFSAVVNIKRRLQRVLIFNI